MDTKCKRRPILEEAENKSNFGSINTDGLDSNGNKKSYVFTFQDIQTDNIIA